MYIQNIKKLKSKKYLMCFIISLLLENENSSYLYNSSKSEIEEKILQLFPKEDRDDARAEIDEINVEVNELKSKYNNKRTVLKKIWEKYTKTLQECDVVEKKSIYFELFSLILSFSDSDENSISKDYIRILEIIAEDFGISEKISNEIRNISYSMRDTYKSINDLVLIG